MTVGSMNLSQLRSTEALPSDEPNNSRTCHPSQGSKPLQNDTADRRSSSLAADGQRLLKKTGSMNALPTATGAPHSRNASRTRTEVIGLKHTRSMHRAESGRVRSAGRSAACYLQKEESYKLRLTVEARIRCPVVEPEMPPMPSGLATAPLVSSGRCNGARGGEEEAAESTVDGLRKQFKSLGGGLNLVDRQPTIGDQARDIRNAIKAIIDDMPEPIPGTPIVIMFNAIVYHENTEGSDQEYALAFSWKSETNTPAGAMIKELKQQRMEQAYREQGVELDSVKAAAAEAAALAQQHTLVGKIKGLFKTGSRSNIKRSSSNLAE
ncbi:hypothetical protein BC830DRAFT_369956 [Chytriomyces sp. MP71]|nr:hypothetical protein BC830DRAFT_369956 [Chytriomyces sp. MP71]